MMVLYHEHAKDPKTRTGPITPERRELALAVMTGGLLKAYQYFRERREAHAGSGFRPKPKRSDTRIGRNDACPCGLGKKYKKCCGGATVN